MNNAFPMIEAMCETRTGNQHDFVYHKGITVLEYFAAAALTGLLANPGNTHRRQDLIAEEATSYAAKLVSYLNEHPSNV